MGLLNRFSIAKQRSLGEISSAIHEQNAGVSQASEAVSSPDQTTQQNAALMEERVLAAVVG